MQRHTRGESEPGRPHIDLESPGGILPPGRVPQRKIPSQWRALTVLADVQNDHTLKDIGVSRNAARREAEKWFWL